MYLMPTTYHMISTVKLTSESADSITSISEQSTPGTCLMTFVVSVRSGCVSAV